MGLSRADAEGLLSGALINAVAPDNATKLSMALDGFPKTRRAANSEFLAQMDTLDDALLARGRAVLDALSDEEWADVIGPDEDDNA